jgi:hypothetical protein
LIVHFEHVTEIFAAHKSRSLRSPSCPSATMKFSAVFLATIGSAAAYSGSS